MLVPINPRHRNPHRPSRQPAGSTSSRVSLTRVASRVSRLWSSPQIPPLDFGEETFWPTGQFISTEPPPTPGGSSVHSRQSLYTMQTSIASGVSRSTSGSQRSAIEYQRRERSSSLSGLTASSPLSPLDVALTTRVSVWRTSGRFGVITTATMEGLIHYLLLKSAGGRFMFLMLFLTLYAYKLILRGRQEGT